MLETLLQTISVYYPLEEQDAGEFAAMKAGRTTFSVRRLYAKGLGTVSVVESRSLLGLQNKKSLIVTPVERDMPLLSYDRIHGFGSDTLIFEVCDTLLGEANLLEMENTKRSRSNLPGHDIEGRWYDRLKLPVSLAKKSRSRDSSYFDALAAAFTDAYLRDSRNAGICDPDAKREKNREFVTELLINGSPITDTFKSALGAPKTAEFFRKILFATET